MTTQSNPVGEEPTNNAGKRLFPPTLIMVACDQCSEPRAWPLTCGHDYTKTFSAEYRHINTIAELERERDELRDVLELIQGFNWQLDDSPHGREIKRRALVALGDDK